MEVWEIITKSSKKRLKQRQMKTACNVEKVTSISFSERILSAKPTLLDITNRIKLIVSDYSMEVVGVGLGNFSSSLYCCTQQALLELLTAELGNNLQIEAYDPAYNQDELNYFSQLNAKINDGCFENERNKATLFIMIHCHYSLYEVLLDQIWIQDKCFAILGNPLREMVKKFDSPKARDLIQKSCNYEIFTTDLALNDTELSVFNV